jgi:heterodisulfide reductase subunit A-like polyferredoxin
LTSTATDAKARDTFSNLQEKIKGHERLIQAVCGYGKCVARCPSSAITQSGLSDCQITAAMEAMLIAG